MAPRMTLSSGDEFLRELSREMCPAEEMPDDPRRFSRLSPWGCATGG